MKRIWIPIFLILTAGALGAEFWAGLDSSPKTVPWTELISTYIPEPITMTALAVLSAWLPAHFQHAYTSQGGAVKNYSKTIVAAVTAGLVALGSALSDDKVTRPELIVIALAVVGALGVYAIPNAGSVKPPADPADAAVRRSYQ